MATTSSYQKPDATTAVTTVLEQVTRVKRESYYISVEDGPNMNPAVLNETKQFTIAKDFLFPNEINLPVTSDGSFELEPGDYEFIIQMNTRPYTADFGNLAGNSNVSLAIEMMQGSTVYQSVYAPQYARAQAGQSVWSDTYRFWASPKSTQSFSFRVKNINAPEQNVFIQVAFDIKTRMDVYKYEKVQVVTQVN